MNTLEQKLEKLIGIYVDAYSKGNSPDDNLNAIANLIQALVALRNSGWHES